MAVLPIRVDVGTTATRLDPLFQGQCAVRNRGAVPVFLGAASVTTASGFQLDPGETFTVELRTADLLFGIVAAGTATCHVLQASGN